MTAAAPDPSLRIRSSIALPLSLSSRVAEQRGLHLTTYPAGNGLVKLPAAWLVEQSGFTKGFSAGPVGISRRHSLAIVNRGSATAADIVALKNRIQSAVLDQFGIELKPEPVFVGFEAGEV